MKNYLDRLIRHSLICLSVMLFSVNSYAQTLAELDDSFIVTMLNRNAQVQANGSFGVGNIPLPHGAFREDENGVRKAQSVFVEGVADGEMDLGNMFITEAGDEIPASISISSTVTVVTPTVSNVQLVTTGALVDVSEVDLTLENTGTFYLASSTAIATVTQDGFVTVVSNGNFLITAIHEG